MGHKFFKDKKILPKKVEVVYCKDCRHFGIYDAFNKKVLKQCLYHNNQFNFEDWYCPEGEKAEPNDPMSCIGGPLVRRGDVMKESEENKDD